MTAAARPRKELPFIEIADQGVCAECAGKYCTHFCPASVFAWDGSRRQTVLSLEGCLECGACAIGCPYDNILTQARSAAGDRAGHPVR